MKEYRLRTKEPCFLSLAVLASLSWEFAESSKADLLFLGDAAPGADIPEGGPIWFEAMEETVVHGGIVFSGRPDIVICPLQCLRTAARS